MVKKSDFSVIIIDWYNKNKRYLPWRQTSDPYLIWLSEVILQQTRIDQGTAYYLKFAEKYPNVKKLAKAPENDVLKLWQGLGYYSRARNLHSTAQKISTEYNGIFPDTYIKLLTLKGVGEYTAAAIASIAFNSPHAAVDGNVYRVLSRYFGIKEPIDSSKGKKLFQKLAEDNMDSKQAGTYNQAVMEFGALQCKPKKPDCDECPLNINCIAKQLNEIEQFPVKKGKTKVTNRYFSYLIIKSGQSTFIKKRVENDIWRNLHDFPMIETNKKSSTKEVIDQITSLTGTKSITFEKETDWEKHILSHQRIHYRFIYFQIDEENLILPNLIKVNEKDIFNFAVPKPIERELNNIIRFLELHLKIHSFRALI